MDASWIAGQTLLVEEIGQRLGQPDRFWMVGLELLKAFHDPFLQGIRLHILEDLELMKYRDDIGLAEVTEQGRNFFPRRPEVLYQQ